MESQPFRLLQSRCFRSPLQATRNTGYQELQGLRKNPNRIYVSTGIDPDERPRPEEQEKGMEPRQPESPAVLLPTRLTSSTPPVHEFISALLHFLTLRELLLVSSLRLASSFTFITVISAIFLPTPSNDLPHFPSLLQSIFLSTDLPPTLTTPTSSGKSLQSL
ncbi:hypothetical protein BDW68DRAFT_19151 [Aspergillus falconensis]